MDRVSTRTWMAAMAVTLLATGCVREDLSDLREFTRDAFRDEKPKVEPLPEIKPHETFAYAASDLVDPFSRLNLREQRQTTQTSGPSPDLNRRKEPLEQFPLDSLRMVGTMFREDQKWVIVRAPNGSVYHAQSGNYVGQNYGKITTITEESIAVRELIQNPNGDWIEREAGLSALDQ